MGRDSPALTARQRGTARRGTGRTGVPATRHRVRSISALIDVDKVVLTFDDGATRAIEMTHNGHPPAGRHIFFRTAHAKDNGEGFSSKPPIAGVANPRGLVIAWTMPDDVTFSGVQRYELYVVSGKTQVGAGSGIGTGGQGLGNHPDRPDAGPEVLPSEREPDSSPAPEATPMAPAALGTEQRSTEQRGTDQRGTDQRGLEQRGTDVRGLGATPDLPTGPDPLLDDTSAIRLSKRDEQLWRELARLATPAQDPVPDPTELIRQYRLLLRAVDRPIFDDDGEPWYRVMELLERNQGRLEGKLTASRGLAFTTAALDQLLADHARLVATEPVDRSATDDPDKQLRYDPAWANLLPWERDLLIGFARRTGKELRDGQVEIREVNTTVKVCIALILTADEWPDEIIDHARAAFSDWKYIVTTVAILGVYYLLATIPDPSFVTKAAAAILTAVLLANFALTDILGFLRAVDRLFDDCEAAAKLEALERAGKRFAHTVGQVGFDIILFLLTWRLGKHVNPRLRAYGSKRALFRAEADLARVRALAGEAPPDAPTPTEIAAGAKVLADARAAAGDGATPGQVLDELAARLESDAAKKKLAQMRRTNRRDEGPLLQRLDKVVSDGESVLRFLETGTSKVGTEKPSQNRAVIVAEARVTRARAHQRGVSEPGFADELARHQQERFLSRMEKVGALKVVASWLKSRPASGRVTTSDLVAKFGEAISMREMELRYPKAEGYEVHGDVQVVTDTGLTKADYLAAGKKPGRLRMNGDRAMEAITDIDTLVILRSADRRWTAIAMEQVKTGEGTAEQARGQNDAARAALERVARGDGSIKIFLAEGKTTLGADITEQFDSTGLERLRSSTRGPDGLGFDETLYGLTRPNALAVARALIEKPGLAEPRTTPPLVRQDEEASVPPPPRKVGQP